eukprot:NODE_907_length_1121_cov_153.567404_g865_i0.p1 GENE.NODE_907_length_1121_cov_153.567404_g865_i0~~NODE_907_length_1121_cov_153.567404_g865_i0.p1  ORF type:complete len:337 (+),score=36.23 NODE_907_length_1121_cov_153.567404_g865_i0:67-1077(+)
MDDAQRPDAFTDEAAPYSYADKKKLFGQQGRCKLVRFNCDGTKLSTLNKEIRIYEEDVLTAASPDSLICPAPMTDSLGWSATSPNIFISGHGDTSFRLWDLRNGGKKEESRFSVSSDSLKSIGKAERDEIMDLQFNPAGTHFLAGRYDGVGLLFDIRQEQPVEIKPMGFDSFTWSRDGEWVYAGRGGGRLVRLPRSLDEDESQSIQLHAEDSRIQSVSLDKSGQLLLTGGTDGAGLLFQLPEVTPVGSFALGQTVHVTRFSHDASVIATPHSTGVSIFHPSGKLLNKHELRPPPKHPHGDDSDLDWHPSERVMAYCSCAEDASMMVVTFSSSSSKS